MSTNNFHTRLKTSIALVLIITALGSQEALYAASRLALVVGNSGYKGHQLLNPKHDSEDMVEALKRANFEVMHLQNLNRRDMARGISEFASRLERTNAIGLFYYAGHGVEFNGVNYLLPLEMEVNNSSELDFEAINVQRVLNQMEQSRRGLNIVIIDACRNNPFRSFRGINGTTGIQRMNAPLGSIISSSTASGELAADGVGRNSPYTKQLLDSISVPGLSLEQIFKRVRLGVLRETNGQQIPWETSSLTDDFYFHPNAEPKSEPEIHAVIAPVSSTYSGGDAKAFEKVNVENLLVECDIHFNADRLVSGEAGGALACYKEVLEINRGNLNALEGLSKIENKYIAWAKRDIEGKNPPRAQYSLTRLQEINPEHHMIYELRKAISTLDNSGSLTVKLKPKPKTMPRSEKTPIAEENTLLKTNAIEEEKTAPETSFITKEKALPEMNAIVEVISPSEAKPKKRVRNFFTSRVIEAEEKSADVAPTAHSNQFRGPTIIDDGDCKICDVDRIN